MNIPIELLVIGTIVLIFILWAVWYNLTNAFYRWRYKPENDKGRSGEEWRRRANKRTTPARVEPDEDAVVSIPRPSSSEGRGILPTAEPFGAGKNSVSDREVGFLARIGRRK